MKIKYHVCKVCGKHRSCDADVCYVPDDWCGAEACTPVPVSVEVVR